MANNDNMVSFKEEIVTQKKYGPAPVIEETSYVDTIQKKYGPAPVQYKYGPAPVEPTITEPIQLKYGPAPIQEKYGPAPIQLKYGPAPIQEKYGPAPVQYKYGPAPTNIDIDITYSKIEENIATLKNTINSLKSSWESESKKNIAKLQSSWAGKDCEAYTNKILKMDDKVSKTISALELLCQTYEQSRDMIKETQSKTTSTINNIN